MSAFFMKYTPFSINEAYFSHRHFMNSKGRRVIRSFQTQSYRMPRCAVLHCNSTCIQFDESEAADQMDLEGGGVVIFTMATVARREIYL